MQHKLMEGKLKELDAKTIQQFSTINKQISASINSVQSKQTFDLTNKLLTSSLQIQYVADDEMRKLYSKYK
jgi:hypothetical protein